MELSQLGEYIYIGVMFVMIIAVIVILRWVNKKPSLTSKGEKEFDERQIAARGRAYKYGFITLIAALFGLCIYGAINETGISIAFIYISLCAGLSVFVVYSIWKDAFLNIGQSPARYLVLSMAIVVLNAGSGIMPLFQGKKFMDVLNSPNGANLMCCVLFTVVTVTLAIKMIVSRKEEREDEES